MPGAIIEFFRLKTVSVPLTLSVALYLFNISINFINPAYLPEEQEFSRNEIESFAELLLEEVGDCKDFFREYDEQESESSLQKHSVSFLYVLNPSLNLAYSPFYQDPPAANRYILFQYSAFLNISTPPPKPV